ncbi:uncharacterized protein LOC114650060 isoform X2 [Erpetoichthys calabaricus]|uniref:uncharacterized protein LOC114650060 isoform X2 n=1 Tax=Erpetoichthys calabaricus TaxID=27687 RepID=UPI002234ABE2|nr:uncharacterized protein LOC114650060 isoform X2 [Erpetoichthys calabaricus]
MQKILSLPVCKKTKAIMIENKVEGTFKLYCKNHASMSPEGSGKRTGRDAVPSNIKEAKEVTSLAKNGSRLPKRNHTVNSRKRKKPAEMFPSDHEMNQSSYDSESTDDSVDYAMPKNHKKSRSIHCDLPDVVNGQPPHENHQYENDDYFGVHNHHTHVSLMDENEAQSESTLDPMLSMPQFSSGKESEFWQLCKKTGCVEKIFSKITDELTNVSMKITNHSASENDYKFAFAVAKTSGLLPQIMSENETDTEAKLESLQVQQNLLTQAKSAMQEVKTKMDQWDT